MHRALGARRRHDRVARRSAARCAQAHPNVGHRAVRLRQPDRRDGTGGVRGRGARARAPTACCASTIPPTRIAELTTALARHGLDFVPLLAPTSTPARIDVAAKVASGFIYYVSLTGITGTALADIEGPRARVSGDPARGRAARCRWRSGFGIRTPGAARAVASFADGVVVGSAAVEVVEKAVAAKTRSGARAGGLRALAARRARRRLANAESAHAKGQTSGCGRRAFAARGRCPGPSRCAIRSRISARSRVSSWASADVAARTNSVVPTSRSGMLRVRRVSPTTRM